MLQILGLSAAAESVYADVVGRREPDVAAAAARRAGDPSALLAELQSRGLIAERVGAPGRYTVAPPAAALEALLGAQREALRHAETAAAELAEAFRVGRAVADASEVVEVVSGRSAMRLRFREIRRGAIEEAAVLVATGLLRDGPGAAGGTGAADARDTGPGAADDEPPRPGLRFRVVLERHVLDTPGMAPRLARILGRREQARVVPRVPTYLVVADRVCAMAQLTESTALVVHAPAVVATLLAGFEAVWLRAEPVRLDVSGAVVAVVPAASGVAALGEPDQLDLRVLALLLGGATDAVVAGQLGVGLRTVQRRIRRLMELAGVQTRIQLGWEARERGWTVK